MWPLSSAISLGVFCRIETKQHQVTTADKKRFVLTDFWGSVALIPAQFLIKCAIEREGWCHNHLKSAGLANACGQPKIELNSSYYSSAFVQKWPQKQSQSIKIRCRGARPSYFCVLACLYMLKYTSDIDITSLQKILATGLSKGLTHLIHVSNCCEVGPWKLP